MSYLFPPRGRPQRMTAAQFAALPEDTSERVELVRGRIVVSPRPSWTHMFVLKKLLFLLIRTLERINIGVRAYPHRYISLGVAPGLSLNQMPAVSAVRLPETAFHLEGLSRGKRMLPVPNALIHILRMDEFRPFPTLHSLGSKSGVIFPLLVEIIHSAVGTGCKYFLRHCLSHKAEALGAFL